jgi:hypothetical protein
MHRFGFVFDQDIDDAVRRLDAGRANLLRAEDAEPATLVGVER